MINVRYIGIVQVLDENRQSRIRSDIFGQSFSFTEWLLCYISAQMRTTHKRTKSNFLLTVDSESVSKYDGNRNTHIRREYFVLLEILSFSFSLLSSRSIPLFTADVGLFSSLTAISFRLCTTIDESHLPVEFRFSLTSHKIFGREVRTRREVSTV